MNTHTDTIHVSPVRESSIDNPEWHDTGEFVLAGDPVAPHDFQAQHPDLVGVEVRRASGENATYRTYPVKNLDGLRQLGIV